MTSRAALPPDFRKLWAAFTAAQAGSAIGMGALPLVAILVLGAADWQISMLAAISGVAAALIALPTGSVIEFRRKRPVMIGANLATAAALVSVPLAGWFGVLGFGQLCVVATVQTLATIVFTAANAAHLKALVPEPDRVSASARLESTMWTTAAIGAPAGGALVSLLGSTVTLAIDAVGCLLSALGISRITAPDPAPPRPEHTPRVDLGAGWRHIGSRPLLRGLFGNGMLFGGALMASAPLLAVLMLRELGLAPWQYGLALGLPTLAGLAGSLCAPRLVTRWGPARVLFGFGTLRCCWLGLVLLAEPGVKGLLVVLAAESALLFCAGVFNPVFAVVRMNGTDDDHLARVGTAWSISAKTVQPVFIVAGAALAAATSTRTAIGAAALVLLAGALFLPWRHAGEVA
ncbi:MFS transporter [Nocardia asteroides]|uniref:MFS transporter n=1 Tax=Nocardia asteroides TaxID=1824 RepID=UPI001E28472C|nr:MFS transporter [Nocardia asteroides]UGT62017.1 MFS transporter [Nocardia asteroides]